MTSIKIGKTTYKNYSYFLRFLNKTIFCKKKNFLKLTFKQIYSFKYHVYIYLNSHQNKYYHNSCKVHRYDSIENNEHIDVVHCFEAHV